MTEGVPFSFLITLLLIRFLIPLRFILLLLIICFLVSSLSSISLAHVAYILLFSYVSSLLFLIVMLLPSRTFHAPSIFLATVIVPINYGSFFSPICFRTFFSFPQSSSTHLSLSSPLPSLRPPPHPPRSHCHPITSRRPPPSTFPASAGSAAAGGTTAAGLSWRAVFALVALSTAWEILAGGSMVIVATHAVVERGITLATAQGTRARGIVREPWCVRATRCLTG